MKSFGRNSRFWFSVGFELMVGCGDSTSKSRQNSHFFDTVKAPLFAFNPVVASYIKIKSG
jgi:hypothetical protein